MLDRPDEVERDAPHSRPAQAHAAGELARLVNGHTCRRAASRGREADLNSRRGALVRITVLSREGVERHRPTQPAVCISITGSGDGAARLPFAYRSVLRLAFDDVPLAPDDCPPGARRFLREDAERIAAFLRRALACGPEEVVVHCEFGASRSAGVALGIADGLRVPDVEVSRLERERPAHHRGIRALVAAALADAARAPSSATPR